MRFVSSRRARPVARLISGAMLKAPATRSAMPSARRATTWVPPMTESMPPPTKPTRKRRPNLTTPCSSDMPTSFCYERQLSVGSVTALNHVKPIHPGRKDAQTMDGQIGDCPFPVSQSPVGGTGLSVGMSERIGDDQFLCRIQRQDLRAV